jgi:hypothetical protein
MRSPGPQLAHTGSNCHDSDVVAGSGKRKVAVALSTVAVLISLSLWIGGPETIGGTARHVPKQVCVAIGLALWLGGWLLELRLRRRLGAITPLLVGVALAAAVVEVGPAVGRSLSGRSPHTWNFYHYYMGAKYFREIGYRDLYLAHLKADEDWLRQRPPSMDGELDFASVGRVRSMETYRPVPRDLAVAGYEPVAFSPERWEAFGRDLRSLHPHLDQGRWRRVLMDMGFNPAPPWTLAGTPLAHLMRPTGWGRAVLTNLDLIFYALALWALITVWGARTTAVLCLWLIAAPFNTEALGTRLVGKFLGYEWLSLSLIAVALFRGGRYRWAGAALSWAAMTRVFPGFLVFPILARMGADLVRGGPAALRSAHKGFVGAFCLCCGLLFAGSHLTGRGLQTWPDWIRSMSVHSSFHPYTSHARIGVGRLAAHQPDSQGFWSSREGSPTEQRAATPAWRRHLIAVPGLLLLLAAVRRRNDLDAMLLMLFAIFLMLTLSRYYASIWALLFLLGTHDAREPSAWPGVVAGAGLLTLILLYGVLPTPAARYLLLNYMALALFAGLCVAYLVKDTRRTARPPGWPLDPEPR